MIDNFKKVSIQSYAEAFQLPLESVTELFNKKAAAVGEKKTPYNAKLYTSGWMTGWALAKNILEVQLKGQSAPWPSDKKQIKSNAKKSFKINEKEAELYASSFLEAIKEAQKQIKEIAPKGFD